MFYAALALGLLAAPQARAQHAGAVRVGNEIETVCQSVYDAASYDCYYAGDCWVEVCEDVFAGGWATGIPAVARANSDGSRIGCFVSAEAKIDEGGFEAWQSGMLVCVAGDASGQQAWCQHPLYSQPFAVDDRCLVYDGWSQNDPNPKYVNHGIYNDAFLAAAALIGPNSMISFSYGKDELCTSLTVDQSFDGLL